MKKIILFLTLLVASPALAQETIPVQRNTAVSIDFTLQPSDSDTLLEGTTLATNDCRLIEVGGSNTDCSSKVSTHGMGYTLALDATDVDTARTLVCFEDQSTGTEAWIPYCIRFLTTPKTASDTSAFYGNPMVNAVTIEGTDATDQLDTHSGGGGSAVVSVD